LVLRALNQNRQKLKRDDISYVYYEEHHIIPKCFFRSEGGHLDGDMNNPNNLVWFTPEEHYLAHQLLVKIYPKHYGLIKAVIMMTVQSESQNGNRSKRIQIGRQQDFIGNIFKLDLTE